MPISSAHSARALVTGATGFIGRHLVRHLHDAGWEVAVLLRRESQSTSATAQSFLYTGKTAEVMRAIADFQPDTVFHLASLFLAQHTAEQIEPLISSNVLLGTQLLEAMRAAGTHSLVNAGTAWQNFAGDAYLPVNLYAATKQAFEDVLLYYLETGAMRAVTLKLFDSYGPGDTRRKLLRLLLDSLRSGEPLAMSGGEQVLDLVQVDDICRAFLRAAELAADPSQPANAVYAVSGGQRRTLRAVVQTLEQVAGRSLPIIWGARTYREREVMLPWAGPSVPGWQPCISLESGLRALLDCERRGLAEANSQHVTH
jgi:nucleoside-diphosphate-sugar epimerase